MEQMTIQESLLQNEIPYSSPTAYCPHGNPAEKSSIALSAKLQIFTEEQKSNGKDCLIQALYAYNCPKHEKNCFFSIFLAIWVVSNVIHK